MGFLRANGVATGCIVGRHALLLVTCCVLHAGEVSAAPDQARFTAGTSACPTPENVEHEVLKLVPADQHELFAEDVTIEVIDLGDGFRVEIEKQGAPVGAQSYADAFRDCERRSRFAAVFVALTLMPPELKKDPLREQYHAPVSVPVPRPEPEATSDLARIELSAVLDWSPPILGAPQIPSPGGELRVALGRGALAGTLAVGYQPPVEFQLGTLEGRVSRMPASAGLRLRAAHESVEVSLDLGGLVSLERIEGASALFSEQRTVVEFGLRAGFLLAYEAGFGLWPLIGLGVSVVPAPRDLATLPRGVVGNTPHAWFGASAGLALSL